jgi:hypothetical protein
MANTIATVTTAHRQTVIGEPGAACDMTGDGEPSGAPRRS